MKRQPSPGRMEAFSDGVIAVIITIMVLEFKVPKDGGMAGFLTICPTLGVYALSFTLTGIYWLNHHHMVDRLKRVDALILWMNLLFLFCLSLLPFFTSYLVQKSFAPFATGIYAGSLLIDGLSFMLLGRAVIRHLQHASDAYQSEEASEEAAEQIAEQRKAWLSVSMYTVGVVLARWHPYTALTAVALVTIIWIVPGFLVPPPRHVRPEELRPGQP